MINRIGKFIERIVDLGVGLVVFGIALFLLSLSIDALRDNSFAQLMLHIARQLIVGIF